MSAELHYVQYNKTRALLDYKWIKHFVCTPSCVFHVTFALTFLFHLYALLLHLLIHFTSGEILAIAFLIMQL